MMNECLKGGGIYNMGSKWSTATQNNFFPMKDWREVALPADTQWRASHGHYRLLEHSLTAERLEQYSLAFEGEQEYEQYMESFLWRKSQECLIAAQHVERSDINSLCGARVRASVYFHHTPHRLSSFDNILLPESLYALSRALTGFQTLFTAIGYFRPSEEMVGIDLEGRVQVWLNSNFSSNYLYGPHYVEQGITEAEKDEQAMVGEVVALFERRTRYQVGVTRFGEYLGQANLLSFSEAQEAIQEYSKQSGVPIPKRFFCLLKGMAEENPDFPQPPQTRRIYYINPELESSHHSHQQRTASNIALDIDAPRQAQGDTTGETVMPSNPLPSSSAVFAGREGQQPKIFFNYRANREECLVTPPQPSHSSTLRNSLATPHFSLPLSLAIEQRSLQNAPTKRIAFSDKHRQHFLDDELAEDMARYLS